ACAGCSLPFFARPSMVTTSAPSACTASIVQDLIARPSTCTVQAPHWLVSQPIWVPGRFSVSRRKLASSTRSSTSPEHFLPFTVISIFAIAVLPSLACKRRDSADCHDFDQLRAVFALAVDVFVQIVSRQREFFNRGSVHAFRQRLL